jgi:hypothetical protein
MHLTTKNMYQENIKNTKKKKGQLKSREQGAWGMGQEAQSTEQKPGNSEPCALSGFHNLLRPLPCASGLDLS